MLAKRLEEMNVQALSHRCRIVWELHNEHFVLGAVITQLGGPAMRSRSILKDDKGARRMYLSPLRNDPLREHVLKQLLIV